MLGVVIVVFWQCTVSAQLLVGPDYISPTEEDHCWKPCAPPYDPDTNIPVPGTECNTFYVCRDGKVTNRLSCSTARSFDINIGACNHESLVNCVDPTCPPTEIPTTSPTENPTESPTFFPSESPTKSPTVSPTESPTESPSASPSHSPTITSKLATGLIIRKKSLIEQYVLKSYTSSGTAYPSIRYKYEGFIEALGIMANEDFDANLNFKLWDRDKSKYRLGLVNVAAFLANAMVEAIYDDTCDELNWQQVAGRYAMSNSCGQEGRSYQDETCGIYSCITDPSMEITAVDSSDGVRAPPPMECRPGSGPDFYSGFWDTSSGKEIKNTPYANTAGRIDIEGCCYWGRGALLTRGSCNVGRLNYFLGARAAREGRRSLYPNIDFCVDPEATCASSATEELRWTTALFEWSERVQRYNNTGWAYEEELIKFFDGGMVDDEFINSVGRVLSRGCHLDGCSDLEVRMAYDRKANFNIILNDVFGVDGLEVKTDTPTEGPTPFLPKPLPTPKPTLQPMDPPALPMPTPQLFNPSNTPRPTPRPVAPYTTPKPTPQPFEVLVPQPLPTNPPFKSTLLPTQPYYPPLTQYPTPMTARPTPRQNFATPLPQYPTQMTTRPTPRQNFSTPRPIRLTPLPSSDSDTQKESTYGPTDIEHMIPSETIIAIEDNGAVSFMLFKCMHLIFVAAALDPLLAMI